MKRTALITATALLTVGMFLFTSCEQTGNDGLNVSTADVESAEDDALAEDVFSGIDASIDSELAKLEETDYSVSLKSADEEPFNCRVVTVDRADSVRFPKTVTIDYGEGCEVTINGDTYTRKGKIIIVVSNRWFVSGATRTVTFEGFYVNNIKIEGTRTVTNQGENENGNLEFEVKLENGKMIFNDTLSYTRNTLRIREWLRTGTPVNDEMYFTGTTEGVNAEGNAYSHTISDSEPLHMIRCEAFRYQWVTVSGVIEINRNGNVATMDYGNGSCDNTAILTVNGETKEIQIRNRYHHRRKVFTIKGN